MFRVCVNELPMERKGFVGMGKLALTDACRLLISWQHAFQILIRREAV